MSDIFSSDEEFASTHSSAVPDVTVEESEESADESVIKITRTKKVPRILDSDSDDDEAERRAISPRTRKSITGFYFSKVYSDEDSDSSEITDSDDDSRIVPKEISEVKDEHLKIMVKESSEISESDDKSKSSPKESSEVEDSDDDAQSGLKELSEVEDSDDDAQSGPKESSEVRKSDDDAKTDIEKNSISLDESNMEKENINDTNIQKDYSKNTDINEKPEDLKNEFEKENIEYEQRYTNNFNANVNSLLSSTIYEQDFDYEAPKKSSLSSNSSEDLKIITVKNDPIELSSDEDDVAIVNPKKNNFVQPKLNKNDFFKIPPPPLLNQQEQPSASASLIKKQSKNVAALQYVSKEFYNKKLDMLMELKQDLQRAEKVAEAVGSNLPDGGRNLYIRCEDLRKKIATETVKLNSMQIEDLNNVPDQKNSPVLKPATWDDLSNAVNQVQPIHTGKKGLQTFNNEKVLTVERLKDLHGSLESRPSEEEMADTPKGLKIELMPHQRHALKWMQWREKQKPRGGILADDMGLGKTLSLISLVLEEKNRRENGEERNDSSSDSESESHSDWNSKGRRTKYNGGTLVVCPASLVLQWEQEVNRRVKSNRLTVCVHHGQSRDTSSRHLRTYDMVVTTYNIVSRENKTKGALFGLKWRRIILDEAHTIRNHKAQMSIAVFGLRGVNRWALTGTPVHNKALDLYALMKFLHCSPFDDLGHWKRWIDKSAGGEQRLTALMQTLMLRRTKLNLQERGDLNCLPEKIIEIIEVPLDKDEMNVYQKIMAYSRTLFAQFLYQRAERNTMNDYIQDAAQPTYKQTMDPNGAYYKLHEQFKRLHTGPEQQVKSHEILTLLLRLRQICCHPGLIDAMLEDNDTSNLGSDQDSTQPDIDLLHQLEKLTIDIGDNNNAVQICNNDNKNDSSTERAFVKASAKVMQRTNPVFSLDRCSSKINAVFKTLQNILTNSTDKIIIVSQWSSVLNIIRNHLERRNIASVTLDGSVPVKDRQGLMNDFNNAKSSIRVLLLSLTAGGVGLNLVGANHMIIVDLHWNPQLEAQAQDRIYRVGQKKTVKIYKLMCSDTVEVRIKNLQDKKMELAKSVVDGTKSDKGSKLSIEDLKGLFGM